MRHDIYISSMPRIRPLNDLSPAISIAFERHINEYSTSITNMKRTLGHSLLAFETYMQWYPLYDQVQHIVGNRSAYLFAWSISSASNCTLCATFFRRMIVEAGEQPEQLNLSLQENALLSFGAAIGKHKGHIVDFVYNNLSQYYDTEELVILIAFAGQMIATNVFNNTIDTEIDTYLAPYMPVRYPQ